MGGYKKYPWLHIGFLHDSESALSNTRTPPKKDEDLVRTNKVRKKERRRNQKAGEISKQRRKIQQNRRRKKTKKCPEPSAFTRRLHQNNTGDPSISHRFAPGRQGQGQRRAQGPPEEDDIGGLRPQHLTTNFADQGDRVAQKVEGICMGCRVGFPHGLNICSRSQWLLELHAGEAHRGAMGARIDQSPCGKKTGCAPRWAG